MTPENASRDGEAGTYVGTPGVEAGSGRGTMWPRGMHVEAKWRSCGIPRVGGTDGEERCVDVRKRKMWA